MEIDKSMMLKAGSIFMVLWGLMSILDAVGLSVGVSFGGGIGFAVRDQWIVAAIVLYAINAILELAASAMGYFYVKAPRKDIQYKMLKIGLLCSAGVIIVSISIMFLGDVSQVNWLSFLGTLMIPIIYLMSGISTWKALKKSEQKEQEEASVPEVLENIETAESAEEA